VVLFALLGLAVIVPTDARNSPPLTIGDAALRDQGRSVESLAWLFGPDGASTWRGMSLNRSSVRNEKQRAAHSGDARREALSNAVLAAESVARVRFVLGRWTDRFDAESGLLRTSVEADGNLWAYGDTGADLYPHMTIAAKLLEPELYQRFENVMWAERARSGGLPYDVDLGTHLPIDQTVNERIFGVAEYAKDGLLPLIDRLGPEPWLGRLREVTDAILEASVTPTRGRGSIPADSTEVNGDMLQVLARLWWATRDDRYLQAAERIGLTYLEDVFPKTSYLPPNRWDFVDGEPLDRRRFRLSDHGNEILPGLIEWHLAESLGGNPAASAHRPAIRRMLERLLSKARTQDGMWLRVIEIPSGRVEQEGVTDAWGYVFQAFLAQAIVEEHAPDGRPELAAEYRDAARRAVRALPNYRNYEWEQGKMDGYADALESALYMLHELREPAAAEWLDDQMPVLYGFQDAETGAVVERDLDGNFVRTSLLYGQYLTRGAWLAPWPVGGMLGGAEDGGCLVLSAASRTDWSGRVTFDLARHSTYFQMPVDYPRLNKWLEWYTVDPARSYRLESGADGESPSQRSVVGSELIEGVELTLAANRPTYLRLCPAATA